MSKTQKCVLLVLTVILFTSIGVNVWAYQPNECKYSGTTFNVKNDCPTSSKEYNAFATAMQDWYNADYRIRITGSSTSSNRCYALNRPDTLDRGNMIPYPNNNPTIQTFSIWINTAISPGTNGYRSTAVHEFGHVLGLGHEFGYEVIMNPYRNLENTYTPKSDDILGVIKYQKL